MDKEGNLHLKLQITGTNAFSALPGGPEGHIQININLIVTPDGKVGIEGGDRTAFPSTGIYVYTMGADGKPAVATLGEGRETVPEALTQPLVPIQPVAPTCNCPQPDDEQRRRQQEYNVRMPSTKLIVGAVLALTVGVLVVLYALKPVRLQTYSLPATLKPGWVITSTKIQSALH